jgi:2-dehydro-3-deoxygluconokinase
VPVSTAGGDAVPVDLLCMGEAMVEFNHVADGEVVRGFGGDTSNCAIAAARQGARVGYLSAVGCDAHGDALLGLWQSEGVDTSRVRRSCRHATGYYDVTHGPDGHRFSYHRAGSAASRLGPEDVRCADLSGVRILHVSGISQGISDAARDAVVVAMEMARAAGARVSYDSNLRTALWPLAVARETIHAAMARSDIALPGLDDARALTGEEDPARIVELYLDLGPDIVALTMGQRGCLLGVEEADGRRRQVEVPSLRVQAVDATAAGDTFDGAFLAMLLAGHSPERAARHASAAAALSTLGYGAVAPMPTRAEVLARLADG